jgi:hypothetical protein
MAGSESSSLDEASYYKNLRENRHGPRHPIEINGTLHAPVTLPSKGEATGPIL